MGYAVAAALAGRGSRVVLVSGPTALGPPAGVERIAVETALEMQAAVLERVATCDLFVGAAAVADYRVADPAPEKLKKGAAELGLRLVRNPDILGEVAALARPPFTLGFAAETERLEEHARAKLAAKGVDMIAANRVGGETGGFEREENALLVLWRGGRRVLPLCPKPLLAESLVDLLEERFGAQAASQDP
jgi:phosphopantothenoylcysteine decarboxylase/phosphopantothenate--cysteine ligase